jgi:integrase
MVLFFSGARVSEAIKLRRDQVAINDQAIYIYNAPVLKQKKKNSRTIQIPCIEGCKLIEDFADYLLSCNTMYLLPAHQKFTGETIQDMHTTRSTVYRKISEIDQSLFPHLLRGWCAGMLVEDFDFNVFDLQSWFNWVSADTPAFYARTKEKELEKKLEITKAPKIKQDNVIE